MSDVDPSNPVPVPTPNPIPAPGSASGPVGETRAYRPGEIRSEGGSITSKIAVTLVVGVVLAVVIGAVVGGVLVFRSAKEKVDEVKTAVESALTHPDCDLLIDGSPVPTDFVVADSIDLSCGAGVDMRLGIVTRCVSSDRQYATNSLGYAFLDDRIYRAGTPGFC
jgi:hypothetical protein